MRDGEENERVQKCTYLVLRGWQRKYSASAFASLILVSTQFHPSPQAIV